MSGCGEGQKEEKSETATPAEELKTEPSPQETASEILPRTEELTGFEQVASPDLIAQSDLADFIGADITLFKRFGVLGAASADYVSVETSQQFTVDTYLFPSIAEAFGIYAELGAPEGNYVSVGAEGFFDSESLVFFKDRYMVRVAGYESTGIDDSVLTLLGRTTALQIEGENSFPAAIEVMPDSGRIEHSCRFYPDSFMGDDFFSPTYTCDYELLDSVSTLFFAPRGSEAEIIQYTHELELQGKAIYRGTENDLELYFFDDDTYGRVIMSAGVGRTAGVLNTPDRDHGMEVLNKLWNNVELR